MSRVEWMNGICLLWSRGRLISPCLSVTTGIWSLAHKSDLRAEISGEIVWYDALAPRPEILLPWCFVSSHAQVPSNSSSYHIRGNEMNCVWSSEYITVVTSFTRASSLTYGRSVILLVDKNFVLKIDHFVAILPQYSLCKMSKIGNTSLLFILFIYFFNIWVDLNLTFFFFFAMFKSKIAV